MFRHLPRQRRLDDNMKDRAAKLLHMNANKKKVQQQLSEGMGKVILLKDLSNISKAAKKNITRNSLDTVFA